jgi:hypothetical protein
MDAWVIPDETHLQVSLLGKVCASLWNSGDFSSTKLAWTAISDDEEQPDLVHVLNKNRVNEVRLEKTRYWRKKEVEERSELTVVDDKRQQERQKG